MFKQGNHDMFQQKLGWFGCLNYVKLVIQPSNFHGDSWLHQFFPGLELELQRGEHHPLEAYRALLELLRGACADEVAHKEDAAKRQAFSGGRALVKDGLWWMWWGCLLCLFLEIPKMDGLYNMENPSINGWEVGYPTILGTPQYGDFEATNTGYMGCFLIRMVINIEVNILTIKDL